MKYVGEMKMPYFEYWSKVECSKIGMSRISSEFDAAAEWCVTYESDGEFSYGGNCVWFSKEEDAVFFALKWLR